MVFDLTILGCNAAFPANGFFTTAQYLNIGKYHFLIDCGEGTQVQMRKFKVKYSKISHIFISHTHGDHLLGLPGVLGTYGLLGRTEPLHIFGPKGVREFIEAHFKYSYVRRIAYPIHFYEVNTTNKQCIFENETLLIETIPLKHDIPTNGFLFREKERPRNMLRDQIEKYQIPFHEIPKIKQGADFITTQGQCIPNETLTTAPPPARAYAFCSDTAYNEEITEQIKEVDLLYHEATFGEDKLEDLKEYPFHSTAKQAAKIARMAKAKKLLIGHFSPRYKDLTELHAQAKTIFSETYLATDGKTFSIPFKK